MSEVYTLKIKMPDTLPDYEIRLKSKSKTLATAEAKEIFGMLEVCMDHEFSVYDVALFAESLSLSRPLKEDDNYNMIVLPPIPDSMFPLGDNVA